MHYLADYHVHTSFSGDCQMPMEDMVKQAITMGLEELALTDHVDYDYPDTAFDYMIDYDTYVETFNEIKHKYKDKIRLLLGVEVGFQPHVHEQTEKFVDTYPFDFVICSTHAVDRLDFCNGDFFKGKEQKEAYYRYFEHILDGVKHFKNYNVYGHLDFIIRYGDYVVKELAYLDYRDIVDEILKEIINSNHGIEVNTSGYYYGLDRIHPHTDIIKRYRELGGEIITVGSDAHHAHNLCSNFDKVYEILKTIGFEYITVFRQRAPEFKRIP